MIARVVELEVALAAMRDAIEPPPRELLARWHLVGRLILIQDELNRLGFGASIAYGTGALAVFATATVAMPCS